MIDWCAFHSIQFIKSALNYHKSDEVRVALILDTRLALLDCLLVFLQNVFAFLEELSPCLGVDVAAIELEIGEVRSWGDEIGEGGSGIECNVEKCDGSTCISCVLFHEEDTWRCFLGFEVVALLLFVLFLDWGLFVEEENAEDWFGQHFDCPFFSGEHFGERVLFCLYSHLLDELVYHFWVRLQRHPVLLLILLLHDTIYIIKELSQRVQILNLQLHINFRLIIKEQFIYININFFGNFQTTDIVRIFHSITIFAAENL